MPDFFQKFEQDRGSVEDLVRKLPGFKGYFAREDRREADALLRERLVRLYGEQRSELNRLQRALVDSGGLKYMEAAQRVDTKLGTLIDSIETAARGYAGLFDAIKVKEEALDRLYAFDAALLTYTDQLATGLRELEDALGTDEVREVFDDLESVVTEALNAFRRRVEAIQGLSEPAPTPPADE